jgi:hypothetical protein
MPFTPAHIAIVGDAVLVDATTNIIATVVKAITTTVPAWFVVHLNAAVGAVSH